MCRSLSCHRSLVHGCGPFNIAFRTGSSSSLPIRYGKNVPEVLQARSLRLAEKHWEAVFIISPSSDQPVIEQESLEGLLSVTNPTSPPFLAPADARVGFTHHSSSSLLRFICGSTPLMYLELSAQAFTKHLISLIFSEHPQYTCDYVEGCSISLLLRRNLQLLTKALVHSAARDGSTNRFDLTPAMLPCSAFPLPIYHTLLQYTYVFAPMGEHVRSAQGRGEAFYSRCPAKACL
jgi:hypothetical protein